MKIIPEIIKQEPVFLGDWAETKIKGMVSDFEDVKYGTDEQIESACKKYEQYNILFAIYDTPGYDGNAWVLFEQGGKLYEVEGSHCSCFGLGGQWEPEEIEMTELVNRIINSKPSPKYYMQLQDNWKKTFLEFIGLKS